MNYIELFGISGSGKTFLKKKLEIKLKKRFFISKKNNIIVNYFIKKNKPYFVDYFRSILILIYYSNFVSLFKIYLKPQKKIIKISNKVFFDTKKRNFFLRLLDLFRINNFYILILTKLENKFKLRKENIFYKLMINEIDSLNQNNTFKKILKKSLLENLVLIKILKENTGNRDICIIDEGIIHKIYIVFSLNNNKKSFLKKILKYYDSYGDTYLVESKISDIYKRSNLRNEKSNGYVYQEFKEILKEYKNFILFCGYLKKNKFKYSIYKNKRSY